MIAATARARAKFFVQTFHQLQDHKVHHRPLAPTTKKNSARGGMRLPLRRERISPRYSTTTRLSSLLSGLSLGELIGQLYDAQRRGLGGDDIEEDL